MSPAFLAALALAALPATNPFSLPEGLASSSPALPPPAPLVAIAPSPLVSPTAVAPVPNLSSSSPSPWGLAGGALIILGLGAATLWMQRRRRHGPRHIQVVETASLGPKRSLALVVVGRQSMLLSCCDSGIFLVSSQPATPEMLEGSRAPVEEFGLLPAGTADSAGEAATPLFRSPRAAGGFAAQLAEAEETQGLRRRLSEAGVVR